MLLCCTATYRNRQGGYIHNTLHLVPPDHFYFGHRTYSPFRFEQYLKLFPICRNETVTVWDRYSVSRADRGGKPRKRPPGPRADGTRQASPRVD